MPANYVKIRNVNAPVLADRFFLNLISCFEKSFANNYRNVIIQGKSKKKNGSMRYNYKILLFLAFWLLIFASCSEKPIAKEPPTIQPSLVLELCHALELGDHAVALTKIKRLRDLKDTAFLAKLELNEEQNLVIARIQDNVNNAKIDEALELCLKNILLTPRNERFLKIKEELLVLKRIQSLVDSIRSANNWATTARSAGALKAIASTYPPAEILRVAADRKLMDAKNIMLREQRLSIIDIAAEIMSVDCNNKNRDSMISVLALVDPQNPVFKYIK